MFRAKVTRAERRAFEFEICFLTLSLILEMLQSASWLGKMIKLAIS